MAMVFHLHRGCYGDAQTELKRLFSSFGVEALLTKSEDGLVEEHGRFLKLLPCEPVPTDALGLVESPKASLHVIPELDDHPFRPRLALQEPQLLPLRVLRKRNHRDVQLQQLVRVQGLQPHEQIRVLSTHGHHVRVTLHHNANL